MDGPRMLAAFDVVGDISPVSAPAAPAPAPAAPAPAVPAAAAPLHAGAQPRRNGQPALPAAPAPTLRFNGVLPEHAKSVPYSAYTNSNINNNVLKKKSHMLTSQQSQSVFPRRQAVNLQFSDITCHVWRIEILRRSFERKQILHGVSGEFRSGELTAIMGPSGAGKSTLLNILAGYKLRGSGGQVAVNGQVRDDARPQSFRRLCCYIQQDDALRPLLGVHEVMMLAANLKLGYTIPGSTKQQRVREILGMLGLEQHGETLSGRLSGGQKKRLSIALELLSNPPVIFLDEPTTGLDSSSTTQCVSLLKSLARDGRTVVCTIHQPSALIFEMFDQLFGVAAGHCVYQGDTRGLVPYLAAQGLHCPAYHNPADYLMEVSTGDFGVGVAAMAEAAAKCASRQPIVYAGPGFALEDSCPPVPAPLTIQFLLLYMRNIIIMRRDLSGLALRLFMHVFIGLVFGYLYRGVGGNARDVLANVVYLYGSNLFLVYTGQMAVTLAFPLEIEQLTREHFNRWYSLPPYLLATLFVELPLQAVLCATYLAPSFWLTEQPWELMRILQYYTLATLSSATAQGCGFLFGATTPITISVFLGPVVAVLLSIFGFCIWYRDIPYVFRWLFHVSYFRAAFQGSVHAMYGYAREKLPCPQEMEGHIENPDSLPYCHYRAPRKILDELDIGNISFVNSSATIVLFCTVMYVLCMCVIWFRLTKR